VFEDLLREAVIGENLFGKINLLLIKQIKSSEEDDESENDKESIEIDGNYRKREDAGFSYSSEDIRTPDLEIKEEEEFLREHEWLRKKGLL